MDDLIFTPFCTKDIKPAFDIYKSGLQAVIEEAFGWNDDFQYQRFQSRYKLEWFHWIENNLEKVGYICFHGDKSEGSDIHIDLLIIRQSYKSMGLGRKTMFKLHALASMENYNSVSLSSFKTNRAAIAFYNKLGYQIINEDEHFYDLRLLLDAAI